jgi:hypothetical protein
MVAGTSLLEISQVLLRDVGIHRKRMEKASSILQSRSKQPLSDQTQHSYQCAHLTSGTRMVSRHGLI